MGAEEDAAARRERLKALRAAKELLSTPDGAAPAPAAAPDAEQHCIRNGEHGMTEEQVDQPELPGPVDAPEDASKENVSPTKESDEVEDNGEVPLKFRNYLPHDERLRGGKVAPLSLPKFEDPIAADAAEPKQLENPFGNIAPKNPNWDLKRDVQKRIDKLEKRTQKALAEIALEQQKEKEALEDGSDAAQE
ncbi:unnamed protein product [Triticum turgidum subsp. durum]|uniref:Coiled-coil domain-containing protein 12 n=1 Tax=Triticum turgidum subsp. durum TaxID=4567 RepID=A0A9R0ZS43_TRITD|nr:unnamed protein product [Triticum turgidum subsp. durum]